VAIGRQDEATIRQDDPALTCFGAPRRRPAGPAPTTMSTQALGRGLRTI
jgi:hypothetical protein